MLLIYFFSELIRFKGYTITAIAEEMEVQVTKTTSPRGTDEALMEFVLPDQERTDEDLERTDEADQERTDEADQERTDQADQERTDQADQEGTDEALPDQAEVPPLQEEDPGYQEKNTFSTKAKTNAMYRLEASL